MSNHPNRDQKSNNKAANPTPAQIKAKRAEVGLTQTQCAELLYSGCRKWQAWEGGEQRMHPALWELFNIKIVG